MKIIDMHCDTIHRIWQENANTNKILAEKWNLESNELMLNLDKMKNGGYSVQNFAMFIEAYDNNVNDSDTKDSTDAECNTDKIMKESTNQLKRIDCFARFNKLLDVFRKQMKLYEDRISMVTNISEIHENETKGKLSAFLTVEGGEACQGDIGKLHYLYEQGVRMMTLTWNFPNELGYPNIDMKKKIFSPYVPDTENGLTETGIEFVKDMERIGMIIDVSHLSDAGFYDVYNNTEKPFVASHSNARKICPFVRNLTDDMIRKLGERGGVTGLNYCRDFLFRDEEIKAIDDDILDQLIPLGFEDIDMAKRSNMNRIGIYEIAMNRLKMNDISNAGLRSSLEKYMNWTCEKIAEHARHIVDVGGMGVLGLGSDFDGIPSYVGMPQADKLDHLAHALHKQGFTEEQIDDIFYNNVMRVYEDILM